MLELDDLIVPYNSFGGDWEAFNEAIYEYFCENFIEDSPTYKGHEVGIKVWDKDDGKEGTFWHVTSEEPKHTPRGYNRNGRTPDIKRAERIRWIREIIENPTDTSIKRWVEKIQGQDRHHLWYNDEFIVVLSEHPSYPYFRLVTAFYVRDKERDWYEQKFQKYGQKKGDAAVATSYPYKP